MIWPVITCSNILVEREKAMETKQFSTAAVLSLYTGNLLCPFDEMHELGEWVMGHPVWTHEFASMDKFKEVLLRQIPKLNAIELSTRCVTRDNWDEMLAKDMERLGESFEIAKGNEVRSKSPAKTLHEIAPGKPHIGITPIVND